VAEAFGDNIVLEDANIEAIRRRLKESHYKEEALANALGSEVKMTGFFQVESSESEIK
jgi:hypothetical protein